MAEKLSDRSSQSSSQNQQLAGPTMASSSSTASIKWRYNVFLSFRGEDTRKKFVSHLYKTLLQKGIDTFKDDEKLERGKSISPELIETIKSSRFSIIVLSKNYASSSWCLEELVTILECRDAMGQVVVPIFYDVDPSHVKKQHGTFDKAFAEHEKRFKGNMETVQKWKDALARVATISGWDSRERDESTLIEQIVRDILNKLAHAISSDDSGFVGLEYRRSKLRSCLHIGSKEVHIIGIWGMGGIGKTTVARAMYDEIAQNFQARCFLENVREESKNSTIHLQKQLLSKIIKTNIDDVEYLDGFSVGTFFKKRLQNLSVLIVLDDVDDKEQLESLARGHDCFGEGSRIIITTRNKEVLEGIADEIYEERGLRNHESLILFSLRAFKQTNPYEDFMQLSQQVIDYTGGNPLALRVMGSFLYGKTKKEWECALERLKLVPHDKIYDVLKISFDGLFEEVKDVFLDVACFLKGKDIDFAKEILRSCGYFPELAFKILIDRCLMDYSSLKLRMHDLIQEMGWEVVRRQSIKKPGRRSRLWWYNDVYHVLATNTGTEKIEGISLDSLVPKDVCINYSSFSNMHGVRLLLIFQKINIFQDSCEGLETLPSALKYLYWQAYPFNCLPPGLYIKNLVVIDMPRSRIKQLWMGTQCPVQLKILNLRQSKCLTSIPDLSRAVSLESLILNDCTSLVEIHYSVGCLKKLKILNMVGCTKLRSFPACPSLYSLEALNLSGCERLEKLPENMGNLRSLKKLHACGTAITEVPSSIVSLSNLRELSLAECKRLQGRSLNLSSHSLKRLDISNCGLTDITNAIGCLSNLRFLSLSGNNFISIPESIGQLSSLRFLHLKSCKELQSLPLLPANMITADASNCTSLERISSPLLHNSGRLDLAGKNSGDMRFVLSNCSRLAWLRQRSILLEAIQGFLPTQAKLLDGCTDQRRSSNNHREPMLSLCFPGDDVPNWFSHRSFGDTVFIDLPLGFLAIPGSGLAICASIITGTKPTKVLLHCHITLPVYSLCFCWESTLRREHVLLGYIPCSRLTSIPKDVSALEFRFTGPNTLQVKSCGVHLIGVQHGPDMPRFLATTSFGSNAENAGTQSLDEDFIMLFGSKIKRPRDDVEVSRNGSHDEEPPAKQPKELNLSLGL